MYHNHTGQSSACGWCSSTLSSTQCSRTTICPSCSRVWTVLPSRECLPSCCTWTFSSCSAAACWRTISSATRTSCAGFALAPATRCAERTSGKCCTDICGWRPPCFWHSVLAIVSHCICSNRLPTMWRSSSICIAHERAGGMRCSMCRICTQRWTCARRGRGMWRATCNSMRLCCCCCMCTRSGQRRQCGYFRHC